MKFLRRFSIKNKLVVFVLLVTTTTLMIGFGVVIAKDIRHFRKEMVDSTSLNAKLIGWSCISALAFEDKNGAQDILGRIELMPSFVNASVFDEAGTLFAVFEKEEKDGAKPFIDENEFSRFDEGHLHISQPIVYQDRHYGTIYLKVSTHLLDNKINGYLITMLALIVGLVVVTFFLASGFQRLISQPILRLADLTKKVSSEADYSVRVEWENEDEIGILYDNFNNMLKQIQSRETAREKAEAALRKSDRKYRAIFDQTYQFTGLIAPDGTVLEMNKSALQLVGVQESDIIGNSYRETPWWSHSEQLQKQLRLALEQAANGQFVRFEATHPATDGSLHFVDFSIKPVMDEAGKVIFLIAEGRDINERKKLEEQLQHAIKMEAVGNLAGGVAHDFNNLMTIVIGYSQLLMENIAEDSPVRNDIEQIKDAGERAASLTRQLLAFSRKQVLQPKVLDLNSVITNVEKMLQRLIGEDIDLACVADPSLGRIMADPSQVEQIIVNLAVNARDAMPRGGKLTIETRNIYLDQHYTENQIGVEPGHYAMLAISDTGIGMDENTISHVFEPFFTTKAQGKGTGLGLATVYGVVKQSGGHIRAYSELGRGTTFKIYVPRVEESIDSDVPCPAPAQLLQGQMENILIVEDDEAVLNVASKSLSRNGYVVFEARDGEAALEVLQRHHKSIHLLLTDVVMPNMSGSELASQVAHTFPDIKVLYVSGYTDDAIIRHGVLNAGIAFLQKPFSVELLLRKIREVLDTPAMAASDR